MRSYICEHCGASLDPGERCDCRDIRVIVLKTDGSISVRVTDGSLEAFQKIVGGYIEHVRGKNVGLLVNEEGLLLGLPHNPFFPEIVGDIIVVKEPGEDDDEFLSLTEHEAAKLIDMIVKRSAV